VAICGFAICRPNIILPTAQGEICMDKSHELPSNPARQYYRYTSAPIEAALHQFLQNLQQVLL